MAIDAVPRVTAQQAAQFREEGTFLGVSVTLPAGSIAVFSSTTLHRSGPNTADRMRPVLVAQLGGAVS